MSVVLPSPAPLHDLLKQLPTAPELGSRALFPSLQASVYVNHAAVSPASVAVKQAVMAYLTDSAALGLGAVLPWIAQRERLRTRIAGLLPGASAADIALTAGTSSGIIDIAMCHPWSSGDRVVLFEGEFPANVTPWLQAAQLYDLQPEWVSLEGFSSGSGEGLAAVEAALKRGAAMVAVSAVQFQTGLRMPVEALGKLCRRYGAALFVDAIQACGVVPVDVEQVDYLACGGHKWMMGLEGVGFLYVDPARIDALRPRLASWLSHEEGLGFLFEGPGHLRYDRAIRKRADMFESSAPQTALFAALDGGLTTLEHIGVESIFAHVQQWHDLAEEGLKRRGFSSLRAPHALGRSGSLCLVPPEGVPVTHLSAGLVERGISVAIPDGRLRLAPHWPNALDEVDGLLHAVDAVVASIRQR